MTLPSRLCGSSSSTTTSLSRPCTGPPRVDGRFTVVADAHSARQALRAAEELSPDLVLLDIHLPDMSGLEVLQRLRARPEVRTSTSSPSPRPVRSTPCGPRWPAGWRTT